MLLRPPALPPGRTRTVISGQLAPEQTGRVATVQVRRRLVPPVETLEQETPVAELATATASMNPAPVAPALPLIRFSRLSVSVTLLAGVGPSLMMLSVKVSMSPAGRLARVAVLVTRMSAEAVGSLPVTV